MVKWQQLEARKRNSEVLRGHSRPLDWFFEACCLHAGIGVERWNEDC